MSAFTQSPAYNALTEFAEPEARLDSHLPNASIEAAGLKLDCSRQLFSLPFCASLLDLAEQRQLAEQIEGLFDGSIVNNTENRAVGHTLLRAKAATHPDLATAHEAVQNCLQRIVALESDILSGHRCGFDGRKFTDVLNIGIGGSDLGPRLVAEALSPQRNGALRCHFVANIDPTAIGDTLALLDPATTLIIICSKTFTTEETLTNARRARLWLQTAAGNADISPHLLAVSAEVERAVNFGLQSSSVLPMWDWVGGRYSLWSAVGLSSALAIGSDHFRELLDGAAAMDEHFRNQPAAANMPVILALLEIGYVNFFGSATHAVIPYCQDLNLLPAFLQQLSMESNGKRVDRQGEPLDFATAPVLWGDVGSNGQHSFHQLLHQGTQLCPIDFILPLQSRGEEEQHRQLVSHCLSQSQAFTQGRTLADATRSLRDRGHTAAEAEQLAPHLVIPGNRPHNILTMKELNPYHLGALLALYEHKTAAMAMVWDINAFDQWGVELGKQLSGPMTRRLTAAAGASYDEATEAIINEYLSGND